MCQRTNASEKPCCPPELEHELPSDQSPNPVFNATATNFRIEAGAPQRIRISGFHSVFERYRTRLDDATCQFGVNDEVQCRCDPVTGTIECEVPRIEETCTSSTDTLLVRARIAEFKTPLLAVKYSVQPCSVQNLLSADVNPDLSPSSSSLTDNTHTKTSYSRILNLLTRDTLRSNPSYAYTLLHQCIAECIGTMFIVIFGVGSVCSAVLLKTDVALWHIATVWGFGVSLAILMSASVSGAHLNPAVSLAFAIFRPSDFPWKKLLPYWGAQYLGGVLGGAFNLLVFGPVYRSVESDLGITRGDPASIMTAKTFGEYFPAPGGSITNSVISPMFALFVEAWGTGILMFVILAVTDPRQKIIRSKEMIPFYIGFTVAVLITLYAPLTQAGWNPARDFGPRIVAALAGWGRMAIPGPRNGFWVYIIGPKIGAPIGAFLYDFLINPGLTD